MNMRTTVLAVALTAFSIAPAVAQETAPTTGRSITTIAQVMVKTREGKAIPLGSRITPGKPTLVSIWASWCPPCIAEAPYLNKIRKDLGSGYNFLYINRSEGSPDRTQPPAAIAQFLQRAGMSDIDYVVADVDAYRQIIGKDIKDIPDGKVGIPRVYLFDAKGRQIHTAYGFGDGGGPELEARVKRAMAAK
ncbi:thiol-disulfide isomerase/thioredoxin [Sphingomonas sp. PP-F2F-G114-C0414]|uniref:TlpA family protein disulfide reductase n=1 Tax=Sphingomonas sp. PP-F2F-G114-C0414 TaxID=2135662 RepID=UPI000F203638|nr:TlpA disulfide reductase family protein [Sphingomonas sp. PP-F2F-G114-C0414]RMB34567.1 thiol-disulfide isomerase/thioredoxin [Sphingomonas sp. PP-F2F-G114-C0414]